MNLKRFRSTEACFQNKKQPTAFWEGRASTFYSCQAKDTQSRYKRRVPWQQGGRKQRRPSSCWSVHAQKHTSTSRRGQRCAVLPGKVHVVIFSQRWTMYQWRTLCYLWWNRASDNRSQGWMRRCDYDHPKSLYRVSQCIKYICVERIKSVKGLGCVVWDRPQLAALLVIDFSLKH